MQISPIRLNTFKCVHGVNKKEEKNKNTKNEFREVSFLGVTEYLKANSLVQKVDKKGSLFDINTYKNKEVANIKAQEGEVFQIEGDKNVSIKEADTIRELAFSGDTYKKLFPAEDVDLTYSEIFSKPVYEFDKKLASLYENPSTKAKFLSMFTEGEGDTIDVNIGGYKVENGDITLVNPNIPTFNSDEANLLNRSETKPLGLILVESAYEKNCEQKAKINIAKYAESLKEALLENPNSEFVSQNGVLYPKKLIENYLLAAGENSQQAKNNKLKPLYDLTIVDGKTPIFQLLGNPDKFFAKVDENAQDVYYFTDIEADTMKDLREAYLCAKENSNTSPLMNGIVPLGLAVKTQDKCNWLEYFELPYVAMSSGEDFICLFNEE